MIDIVKAILKTNDRLKVELPAEEFRRDVLVKPLVPEMLRLLRGGLPLPRGLVSNLSGPRRGSADSLGGSVKDSSAEVDPSSSMPLDINGSEASTSGMVFLQVLRSFLECNRLSEYWLYFSHKRSEAKAMKVKKTAKSALRMVKETLMPMGRSSLQASIATKCRHQMEQKPKVKLPNAVQTAILDMATDMRA
ncbi:MAG: hypothetical protein Q9178_001441 [Gyalolechia marmorata]